MRDNMWGTGAKVSIGLSIVAFFGFISGWFLQEYDADIEFKSEASDILDILRLHDGAVVADLWAGDGRWSIEIAQDVGPQGEVFVVAGPEDPISTIYQAVADARLENVTLLAEAPFDTFGLSESCCDAILVRRVYHHWTNRPRAIEHLYRDLRPGGRLVVIDFDVGTENERTGHGIDDQIVTDELLDAGFELAQFMERWTDGAYCAVFRRPVKIGIPGSTEEAPLDVYRPLMTRHDGAGRDPRARPIVLVDPT